MKRTLDNEITCMVCGGDAILKYGDYERNGIVHHDFPYWECSQCGEKHYDIDMLIELDEREKKVKATA
ncbi:YgiT-type zinc finger protein [uncultured Selenomonas sp.]|uniref:YgiT-type zinc finger protein n=1 Tax=uncultured Selenomonas sp. TaxID=159275 RepID=UPI0025EC75CD|nr:YgiT-type zinc finger protein [uncultured Selenomonas sp.]